MYLKVSINAGTAVLVLGRDVQFSGGRLSRTFVPSESTLR
jgi:hypothetical protein